MAKASIGQDGLYLDGKLCCTLPPSGAENTGLSSDVWPLVVKIQVFGMIRYIALSNTGHYSLRQLHEMCLDLYDVKLNCLQECLKAVGTPLANDFCLRRDDAGNAVLFMRNKDEYLAVAVSEKYPNMAVRSIVNALINVSPDNKIECTQSKHPTLCLATGSFEQAPRYEMLGWQCVSIALYASLPSFVQGSAGQGGKTSYQPSKWHGKVESAFAASKELLLFIACATQSALSSPLGGA